MCELELLLLWLARAVVGCFFFLFFPPPVSLLPDEAGTPARPGLVAGWLAGWLGINIKETMTWTPALGEDR